MDNENYRITLDKVIYYILAFYLITRTVISKNEHYLIYKHFDYFTLVALILIIFIYIFLKFFIKKCNLKIDNAYRVIFILSTISFLYLDLPQILHFYTKKNITIEAKVISIISHERYRANNYKSIIIETNSTKFNNKEIKDLPSSAFNFIEKNDMISIKGSISKYMFKTHDIQFYNSEKEIYYKRSNLYI